MDSLHDRMMSAAREVVSRVGPSTCWKGAEKRKEGVGGFILIDLQFGDFCWDHDRIRGCEDHLLQSGGWIRF